MGRRARSLALAAGLVAALAAVAGAEPSLTATYVEPAAPAGGRIALRAGVAGSALALLDQPSFGVTVGVVHSRALDVALATDYEPIGFNMVPALVPRLIVGTRVAAMHVQAQLAYGQGLADGERYGDAQLTALHPLGGGLAAGAGSRLRLDLQHDAVEPVGERAWDVDAGPMASLAVGRVTVAAMGGVTAWQEHTAPSERVGAIAELGLASSF
jgi:hypothetical protein